MISEAKELRESQAYKHPVLNDFKKSQNLLFNSGGLIVRKKQVNFYLFHNCFVSFQIIRLDKIQMQAH